MIAIQFHTMVALLLLLFLNFVFGDQHLPSCCITSEGLKGACLRIKQCPKLYRKYMSGKISSSDLKKRRCDPEGETLKLCCLPNENQFDKKLLCKPPSPIQARLLTKINLLPNKKVCGVSTEDRIVGGDVADLSEFPWMALIQYDNGKNKKFHCGGSLINERYVLTAAHCFNLTGLKPINVRLGEFDISTEKDCLDIGFGRKECSDDPIDIPIEDIILHPMYSGLDKNQYNDIALIRLSKSVNYTRYIQPICIPSHSNLNPRQYMGQKMFVAGWGATGDTPQSNLKLKLKIPIKPSVECAKVYREHRKISLEGSQICAGGEKNKDSCRGDSGGPLMMLAQRNWYVAGVVSFGADHCGMEGWPAIYTRVGSYSNWIIKNVKP